MRTIREKPLLFVLMILAVILVLEGCIQEKRVLPYVAQVESVEPQVPGLEIRGTVGGGGELEVVNHTDQDVTLFDEQGTPYVRIQPDGVYEFLGNTWKKTKDTPIYYCHDYRIFYQGPEPSTHSRQLMKTWAITGNIGGQTFLIKGHTDFIPQADIRFPITLISAYTVLSCVGIISICVIVFMVSRRVR
jgi:hypothetical protein